VKIILQCIIVIIYLNRLISKHFSELDFMIITFFFLQKKLII